MIRFFVRAATLPVLFLSTLSIPAGAKDHLLVIAGGHASANNQISLEKNVLFFRKVAAEKAPGAPALLSMSDEFRSLGNDVNEFVARIEAAA